MFGLAAFLMGVRDAGIGALPIVPASWDAAGLYDLCVVYQPVLRRPGRAPGPAGRAHGPPAAGLRAPSG